MISCKLFNKGDYNYLPCNRAHKCKKCNLRDYKLLEYISKGEKRSWQLAKGMEVVVKDIKIVKIISLANKNNFYKFIYTFFISFYFF